MPQVQPQKGTATVQKRSQLPVQKQKSLKARLLSRIRNFKISINMETQELELKVIGLPTMIYTIQGKATITEERTL